MTDFVPTVLHTLSNLSDTEQPIARRLSDKLNGVNIANSEALRYYEGKQKPRTPAVSVPPKMRNIETVLGWPSIVVDVLEERLDFEGWVVPGNDDAFGLKEIYDNNLLAGESGLAHLDALMYGLAFIKVGTGEDDEPNPLITVESPLYTTALYDGRSRRITAALTSLVDDENQADGFILYLPKETITVDKDGDVIDRDRHNLGRVPVVRLANRARSERVNGRSEITRAIRSITDQALRTLLRMDVNGEFYSAPQRYLMGAEESMFENADGTKASQWEAILGRILAIPFGENGEVPVAGQFPANSPLPFLDQIRGLSQMVAAEASLPASYFGFVTDNPTSADAIRQGEARLIKRAERRQLMFTPAWFEVARIALLIRDGSLPADFLSIKAMWRDAATPTRSAAADEAVKLIGAAVLPPDSDVTLDRLGFTETDKERLKIDRRRSQALQAIQSLAAVPPAGEEVADGDAGDDLRAPAQPAAAPNSSGARP